AWGSWSRCPREKWPGFCRLRRRQDEVKARAAVGVVLGPEAAAVDANDRAAHREAEPHPFAPRREERLEDAGEAIGGNPRPRVRDGDPHTLAVGEPGADD